MGRPVRGKRSSRVAIAAPVAQPDARISRDLTSAGCSVPARGGLNGKPVSMLIQFSPGTSESEGEYGKDVQVSDGLGRGSCVPSASITSREEDMLVSASSSSDTDGVSRTLAALDAKPRTEGASTRSISSHSCCVTFAGRGKISCISVKSESCACVNRDAATRAGCGCASSSDLRETTRLPAAPPIILGAHSRAAAERRCCLP